MALLIAGGKLDPNLEMLNSACADLGVSALDLRHDPGASPSFHWDVAAREALIGDARCRPAAAFVRHDVFEGLSEPRPATAARAFAWFQAVHGWLLADPAIRIFNRDASPVAGNKAATLVAARQVGLSIPATVLTNIEGEIREAASDDRVTKPVAGGDYCYTIPEALERTEFRNGLAASPAFLQPRLVSPEFRIYIVGGRVFTFEMRSSSLDYRVRQDVEVIPLAEPPNVVEPLRRLLEALRMNYGAADFKTDSQTGELNFLELNTSPMFAQFNLEAGGELCRAMIEQLLDLPAAG